MKDKQDFKLIDGIFNPTEASRVLTTLINSKINYHNLDDFSNHIRFNNDVSQSKKRIAELNATKERILDLIEIAEANGFDLVINSTIEIKFNE